MEVCWEKVPLPSFNDHFTADLHALTPDGFFLKCLSAFR
jgi:hypothetical protein